MANFITCPSCEASLKFSDEKRGKKVRCRKCDGVITLPEAKGAKPKGAEDAIEERKTPKTKLASAQAKSTKLATGFAKSTKFAPARPKAEDDADARRPKPSRAKSRDDDDDDDDDRPRKKKGKADKKGLPLVLILGGVGAAFLLLLVCGGATTAFFAFRAPAPAQQLAARNDDANRNQPAPELNPGPVNNPQPAKNPEPIRNPNPGSDQLTPEAVKRVEEATVYLFVHAGDGSKGEGSGFFCIEPGLVITNAHVVGMMQAKSPRPKKIDVVLHSGNSNELTTTGQLVGVDRESDLAVIRIAVPNAPPPLTFEDSNTLFRTQKVFISGFPLGRSLGKEITISPSSISSLRKDTTGTLAEIQVNGGMSPGNSGGPVISPSGRLVGVAVAGIRGTQINFAVPGDHVKRLMDGRPGEVSTGEAFLQNGQTRLPIKVTAIDPLNKIRSMRIEVWTGIHGQPRPLSYQQPQPLAGDGPRQAHPLSYQGGLGSADISVPTANPGQVYWLQPVITNADGKTQWGVAIPTEVSVSSPLERKPADLTVNLTAVKDRTVSMKSSLGITIPDGKIKHVIAVKVDVDLLEVMHPDPKGSRIKTAMGTTASYIDIDGDKKPATPQSVDLVRQGAPQFVVDNTNKLQNQINRKIPLNWPADLKKEVERTTGQFCNSYQAVNLPMPNRLVQPAEKWNTTVPLILGTGPKAQILDLVLTCTYEGVRTRNQRSEGLITVTGVVRGRSKFKGKAPPPGTDEVRGKVAFDLAGGFISFAQLKITSEGEQDTFNFDIDLTRSPGNANNLALAPEKDPPPGPGPMPKDPPGAAKVVLQIQNGVIALSDPIDLSQPKIRQVRYKVHPVQMQAGKTYTITLNTNGFNGNLRLFGNTGLVAQNAGLNTARLTYTANAPGIYNINVSTNNVKTGQYQLTVTESP